MATNRPCRKGTLPAMFVHHSAFNTWNRVFISKLLIAPGLSEILMLSHQSFSNFFCLSALPSAISCSAYTISLYVSLVIKNFILLLRKKSKNFKLGITVFLIWVARHCRDYTDTPSGKILHGLALVLDN